jgi:hypothetical protein
LERLTKKENKIMALPLIPAAIWIARSLGYGYLLLEGNRFVRDTTSSKPLQNPSSLTLRAVKESLEITDRNNLRRGRERFTQ